MPGQDEHVKPFKGGHIALGMLPLSIAGRPSEADAISIIRAAAEVGIRLVDTADVYGTAGDGDGYGEYLLRKAIRVIPRSERPMIATKGGLVSDPSGKRTPNGQPDYLRHACRQSLQRLGVEVIDLYQLHRPDPLVPFAETVGALKEMWQAGQIRMAGVSNVSVRQVEVAREILGDGLASVQNRFSVDHRTDKGVVELCGQYDLKYLAWAPLGGVGMASALSSRVPAIYDVGIRHGVSPQRIALAWLLSRGSHVVPIVGTRSVDHLTDAVAAVNLSLSQADIKEI